MVTTKKNAIDTSSIHTLTGFSIVQETPEGTDTRFLVRTADDTTWKKYDPAFSVWKDTGLLNLKPAFVMTEGNTADELNAVPAKDMTDFTGKTIHVAAALQATGDAQPTIKSFSVEGVNPETKTDHTVFSPSLLDKYDYENVYAENGKIAMRPPIIAVALLQTGGGSGKWARTDINGNEV